MPSPKRGLPGVLYYLQGGLCFYCGGQMAKKPAVNGTHGYSRDHVVPRAAGGGYDGNTVLCHPACNNEKGHRFPTPDEVRRAVALYRRAQELLVSWQCQKHRGHIRLSSWLSEAHPAPARLDSNTPIR